MARIVFQGRIRDLYTPVAEDASCSGAIGLSAAAVKSFTPWSDAAYGPAIAKEFIGATLAFALLCGLMAALRNSSSAA